MNWRRFLTWLLAGLAMSGAIACTQVALRANDSPESVSVVVEEAPAIAEEIEPPALPPETAALVASAGGNGLYDPPRGDVRLMVISDLNSSYGSVTYDPEIDRAMQLVPFWNPDMVVCSGDMVAGQDRSLTEAQMWAMWNGFDQAIASRLRAMGVPFGFTVGNHDASGARASNNAFVFAKEREVAQTYWNQPEHNPGVTFIDRTDFPFYYTFEYNGIFFLAWDGSTHRIPAEKLAWVEQTLASEAAQSARMRVLLGHLPLYGVATGRDRPGEVMAESDRLRALLERYNVHTYISGHHHAYYPAHKGTLQLLHTGNIGSGPRALIDSTVPPRKALTILDVDFESPDLTTYTTYDIQTLQVIPDETLPRFLLGHNGRVLRRDVDLQDLTPAEASQCQQRLGTALCES